MRSWSRTAWNHTPVLSASNDPSRRVLASSWMLSQWKLGGLHLLNMPIFAEDAALVTSNKHPPDISYIYDGPLATHKIVRRQMRARSNFSGLRKTLRASLWLTTTAVPIVLSWRALILGWRYPCYYRQQISTWCGTLSRVPANPVCGWDCRKSWGSGSWAA